MIEPLPEDEEDVIVAAPPPREQRWGFVPPFFGGPRGEVLRPFEAPPREAMRREVRGENCHYHAWPTEDMAFHRGIRCHWHQDPGEPSLRYVR